MSKLQQIVVLCEAGERAPIISASVGVRLDEVYVVRRLGGFEPPPRRQAVRRSRVMPSPHPVKTPGDFVMKPTIRDTCTANRDHFTADHIAARLGVTKGVVIGHWYRARTVVRLK